MLHRAPNGDLATIQTTGMFYPTPLGVQELWDNVTQRRAPSSWDGIEPEGALIVWWAEPVVEVQCGNCTRLICRFRSYHAGEEVGVVCVDTRRGRLTANRSMRTNDPRYHLDGDVGSRARGTFAHIHCPRCRHRFNRRLDRLGTLLWDTRPTTHMLNP
jgi:ribosomal protein S27E